MLYKNLVVLFTRPASVYIFFRSIILQLIDSLISASNCLYSSIEVRCLILLSSYLALSLITEVFNTINCYLLKSLILLLVKYIRVVLLNKYRSYIGSTELIRIASTR